MCTQNIAYAVVFISYIELNLSCFYSLCLLLGLTKVYPLKLGISGLLEKQATKLQIPKKKPVKWMPPEMLQDGISTEKTDVVSCKKYCTVYTYLQYYLSG